MVGLIIRTRASFSLADKPSTNTRGICLHLDLVVCVRIIYLTNWVGKKLFCCKWGVITRNGSSLNSNWIVIHRKYEIVLSIFEISCNDLKDYCSMISLSVMIMIIIIIVKQSNTYHLFLKYNIYKWASRHFSTLLHPHSPCSAQLSLTWHELGFAHCTLNFF